MSELLVSTLTVSFSEKDIVDSQIRNKAFADISNFVIVLEQMTTDLREALGSTLIIEDTLFFKCYPSSDVYINASMGTASISSEVRVSYISDVVSFGGTDNSMLSYPEAYEVSISPLGTCIQEIIATRNGQWYNGTHYQKGDVMDLKIVTPSFRFNDQTNSVEAFDGFKKIEIYGSCLVSYKTKYSVITYRPNFSALVERTNNDKRMRSVNDKLYAGTLQAYRLFNRKTYVVSKDVEVEKVKSPEYARVYSKIVLDEDGAHEAPEGWTEVTNIEVENVGVRPFNYLQENGTIRKDDLDPNQSFTDQRVHLIVTIDMYGNLIYDYQNHWLLDPFNDVKTPCESKINNPKPPEFYLKFASPPGGAKTSSAEEFMFEMMATTWRNIFLIPNKEKFKEKMIDYYTAIKGIEEE